MPNILMSDLMTTAALTEPYTANLPHQSSVCKAGTSHTFAKNYNTTPSSNDASSACKPTENRQHEAQMLLLDMWCCYASSRDNTHHC
jgi:hypothetical protein